MSKIRMIEISVVSGLIFSLIFSVVSFAVGCNDVRDSVLRLHILANSDSDDDQMVKLVVRDKLLKSGADIFEGNVSVENAKTYLNNNFNVTYMNKRYMGAKETVKKDFYKPNNNNNTKNSIGSIHKSISGKSHGGGGRSR